MYIVCAVDCWAHGVCKFLPSSHYNGAEFVFSPVPPHLTILGLKHPASGINYSVFSPYCMSSTSAYVQECVPSSTVPIRFALWVLILCWYALFVGNLLLQGSGFISFDGFAWFWDLRQDMLLDRLFLIFCQKSPGFQTRLIPTALASMRWWCIHETLLHGKHLPEYTCLSVHHSTWAILISWLHNPPSVTPGYPFYMSYLGNGGDFSGNIARQSCLPDENAITWGEPKITATDYCIVILKGEQCCIVATVSMSYD